METKTFILKNDIVLKDSRKIDCGISIENQTTNFIVLGYSSMYGFFLNIKALWLNLDDYENYLAELISMKEVLEEASSLIVD